MWWNKRRKPATEQQLVNMLQLELDRRGLENERLHTLLAREQQLVQDLSKRLEALTEPREQDEEARAPGTPLIHTYLSQLIPVLLGGIGFSLVWQFFVVDDPRLSNTIIAIEIVAITALVIARRIRKQLPSLEERALENRETARRHLVYTLAFIILYLLGVVLFIVATILMATG